MDYHLKESNAIDYLASHGLIESQEVTSVQVLEWGVSNILVKVSARNRCMVVKQSLPQLRVAEEWLADQERIYREWGCIEALESVLPEGTLPTVLHADAENFLFVMSCAPDEGANWKEQLLAGRVDTDVAEKVGQLLGLMHGGTAGDAAIREQFIDDQPFIQLRIDPYHWTTAKAHPDVGRVINDEAQRMLEVKTALVHGDYSPKNIIVAGKEVFLLDFEVAHYGNPVFDLAFLLNHLYLKSIYNAHLKESYFAAVQFFWEGYASEVSAAALEQDTVKQVGCLMLARMDGKSPVEYIVDSETKDLVRGIAKSLLLDNLATIDEVTDLVGSRLSKLDARQPRG